MNILRLLVLALSLVSLQAFGRANMPIIDHEGMAVTRGSGQPATLEQVQQAIQAAAASRNWQLQHSGPGKAVATLNVRGKHTVSVDISYTPQQYSVKYRDSTNMHYVPGSPGTIHPHYNSWVQSLVDGIRMELGRN